MFPLCLQYGPEPFVEEHVLDRYNWNDIHMDVSLWSEPRHDAAVSGVAQHLLCAMVCIFLGDSTISCPFRLC